MEKNIELAIQKEIEYITDKVERLMDVNIYDYLAVAGYDDLNEFNADKSKYNRSKIRERVSVLNIEPVSGSADILQPMAYQNYQEGIPFCYFVEFNKVMALLPLENPWEGLLDEKGIPFFKCGNSDGGLILSYPQDLNCCICLPKKRIPELDLSVLMEQFFKILQTYFPTITMDGNDVMCDGKKVVGTVGFEYNGMIMFAFHMSIVDSNSALRELGIVDDETEKQPGCLPYYEGIKDIIKDKITQCLR